MEKEVKDNEIIISKAEYDMLVKRNKFCSILMTRLKSWELIACKRMRELEGTVDKKFPILPSEWFRADGYSRVVAHIQRMADNFFNGEDNNFDEIDEGEKDGNAK